ncbi:MAG: hypothetical protein LCH30_01105 [Proteobacteria bacterium]|nr:hypothetical protein [Pseudomonadota bacterium]
MNEETINFATITEEGEIKVEALSSSELAARTSQNFIWTNEVILKEDKTLSCYLLKLEAPTNIESDIDINRVGG